MPAQEIDVIERGKVDRPLYPHVFWCLWELAIYGPLTAAELADDHNRPTSVREDDYWNGRDVSNRLRSAQALGLVAVDDDGFWLLTGQGRRWIQGGVS